jgi:hypothetical protein
MYSNFARLQSKLTIQVQPRPSLLHLTVEHNAPSLNGEWYPMKVNMRNGESTIAKNAVLHVTLLPITPAVTVTSPASMEAPVGAVKLFASECHHELVLA